MEDLTLWLTENWKTVLIAFYIIEKIVKLSPAKWDDILVDGIKWAIWRITGKAVITGR